MEKQNLNNYFKLFGSLAISFIIMYAVMFLNADKFDHVYLSATRLYMSLLMIAPMALLMLIFMYKMFQNKKLNVVIALMSIIVFLTSLFFLRTQTFVNDKQFLRAMVPHHSSAILTSSETSFEDPETKQLAEDIIIAQEKEIEQMKNILERL